MPKRLTALFADLNAAEDAIFELRRHGLQDRHLSVLTLPMAPEDYPAGAYFSVKPPAGADGKLPMGLLWGLPMASTPGPWPVAVAGGLAGPVGAALAEAAGSGLGPAEAIALALTSCGWEAEEADRQGQSIAKGAALLVVSREGPSPLEASRLRGILGRHGGRLSARPTASLPGASPQAAI